MVGVSVKVFDSTLIRLGLSVKVFDSTLIQLELVLRCLTPL